MAANEAKIIVVADDKASPTLTGIGEKAKSMRGAFLAVGAAGAAVTGAIGLSIKSFAQAGDEIQKMALRTGLTTESLSELKFALEQSGSNIEGFEKGIRRMSSFIQDGRDGLTETTRALDSLGIAVSDFDGMSPEQAFDTLSTALAGVDDSLAQAALAQDIFGRSGTALLPLLSQGADGIEALKQQAQELGIVFDQDAANAAARLVDAQNTLKQSFQGVQIALAEGVAPALAGALEKFGAIISKVTEFARENPTLTKTIIALGAGLGTLAIAIAGVGLVLPVMATGLAAVSVGFIGLNVATGGLIIGIGALVAGLVLLVSNWDAVVEAFKVGANFMIGIAEFIINTWLTVYINPFIKAINLLGSAFGFHVDEIEVSFGRIDTSAKETTETVTSGNDQIIESEEQVALAFTATAESAEEAAERILEAQSEKVAQFLEDGKLMTDIDQRLRDSQAAVMEGHIAAAQAIVDASNERYEKIAELRAADLADDLASLKLRSDAVEALKAENLQAFRAIEATVNAAPSLIQVGGGSAEERTAAGSARRAFKDSQNDIENQLAEARARMASGDFAAFGVLSKQSTLDDIARLEALMQSDQFKGGRFGKFFEPEGGFGSGAPPTLPGMGFDTTGTISAEEMRRSELLKANPGGITINIEGSVVAEDLPSVVERGLRELANQGGGFVDGQHFLEQNG